MHSCTYSDGNQRRLSCMLLMLMSTVVDTVAAAPDPVAILRAQNVSLSDQLQHNQFKRPLVLQSTESSSQLKGDIHAVIDYPFDVVSRGLNSPDHWCGVMILHLNTKYCRAMKDADGTALKVYVGKKTPQELSDATRVDFRYSVAAANQDYLDIRLYAKNGPLGTSNYRIQLEVVSLPNTQKSFMHLTYSYTASFSGRLAMKAYLATIGRGKVGFTVTGKQANGQPDYVDGVRGVIERNTMRYYLAIDTVLAGVTAVPPMSPAMQFQNWFAATEQFSRQLHEVSRHDYLQMKHAEYLRQRKAD